MLLHVKMTKDINLSVTEITSQTSAANNISLFFNLPLQAQYNKPQTVLLILKP